MIGVISIGDQAPRPPWLRLCFSAGPLALCHTVNPALAIALRLQKGKNEDLRYQLSGQKPLILLELYL